MQTLFSILHSSYRKKTTHALQLRQNDKNCGHLYIQEGVPLSCYFLDLQGLEALDLLYRDEKLGFGVDYVDLDCLAIYSENIKEYDFEKIILNLFEKQKIRKVFKNIYRNDVPEINYWQ